MMFLLIPDVTDEGIQMPRTDRKSSVSRLPSEIGQISKLAFDPFGGVTLQVEQQVGDGDLATKATEDVDMVLDAIDGERRAVGVPANTVEVSVDFLASILVSKERRPIFCRKDDVQMHGGE